MTSPPRCKQVSLRGATFTTKGARNDAGMHAVDVTGAQTRGALFGGCSMRGIELVDIEACMELSWLKADCSRSRNVSASS